MYAQQMAKGKAALQRGAYGDILSKLNRVFFFFFFNPSLYLHLGAYVYGLNRTIPATYAGPIYPFSPGMFYSFDLSRNRKSNIFSYIMKIHFVCVFVLLK
jgi:hypothetical protein